VLAQAQASLAARGIHRPTPEQLRAALDGTLQPAASNPAPAPAAQQPVGQRPLAHKPNAKHNEPERNGPEKRLVEKYDRFAGSDKNAHELLDGLRNDTQIELSKDGKTTTFTPATGKMGWGNVDHALALAKASLADHGIHKPTPEQIKAALNGGTVTTKSGQSVSLAGVLKLRASGMGWGQIAQKLGFKLGDVKRADKHRKHDHDRHDHKHAHKKHDHKPAHWKHERADWKRHDKPDFHRAKFDRPHRPDKFDRPARPERPERPERHDHRR
jgi:hypothetical protein